LFLAFQTVLPKLLRKNIWKNPSTTLGPLKTPYKEGNKINSEAVKLGKIYDVIGPSI